MPRRRAIGEAAEGRGQVSRDTYQEERQPPTPIYSVQGPKFSHASIKKSRSALIGKSSNATHCRLLGMPRSIARDGERSVLFFTISMFASKFPILSLEQRNWGNSIGIALLPSGRIWFVNWKTAAAKPCSV